MTDVSTGPDLWNAIRAIWSEVLDGDAVRPSDDFFALGGTSLTAAMVTSRVRERTGADVPMRTMFLAPTLEGYTAAVTDLLEARSRGHLVPTVDTVDRDGPLPVSAAQERMWFLHQMLPNGSSYNLERALRLSGPLHVDSLQWAFDRLVERHESLRTTFEVSAGRPVQRIAATAPVALEVVDCTTVADRDRLPFVVTEMQRVVTTPFDLAALPLMRAVLYRLDHDDHVLFTVLHHVICDDWALGLVLRDVADHYNAHRRGSPSAPRPLEVQPVDFAAWHSQWLDDGPIAEQLGYWRTQLADMTPSELPADHVRPATRTSHGAAIIHPYDDGLAARVDELARRHGASSFMVLLATFQLLLHRYTGDSDIAVGSPVANRNWVGSEDLVTTLVNTVVLRTDLTGDPTFDELVERVRAVSFAALEHQDVPFDRLVSELRPPRDPSRSPFFQAFFNGRNTPIRPPRFDGLTVAPLPIDPCAAQFDISLAVDSTWSTSFVLDYNTDLYETARMERLLGHYLTLLEAALATPHVPISQLPMLTPQELAQLEAAEHATAVDYPRDAVVHELIAAQARLTADTPAVSCGGRSLTFAEVDARANQLAHHLIDLDIVPGLLVGLYLERSPAMVVAALATLKAGAAYLPLDPGFPVDRLEFMLADSQTDLVITTADLLAAAPSGPKYVCLERDEATISQHPTHDPAIALPSDALAYVIYTSGSTGRPKGVQIEHRNVVNFLLSMAREPGLTSADTLLAVTTLSFDISVLEIFLPLLTGAHLVLVDRATTLDPLALSAAMHRAQPTVMQATPTTWRMLVDAGWSGDGDLRVLCGGEALTVDLATALLPRCAALWNMYGPTETTVWSAVKRIAPGCERITIGAPIANTSLHVVDTHFQPRPVGVPGELLIGGDGLARGYLDRPELTADRFISHPTDHAARLYRTGDLAQRLGDGDIEILGRIDNQVKVRGHRIELGEIEATLASHPDITRAVVVTHEHAPGDVRLVAYYTFVDEPNMTGLRAHLQATLPSYMVPAMYVPLDAFPLTPNKKVDRNALPPPTTPAGHAADDPPRPGIEEAIAAIWQDVLDVTEIDRDDDFFDLGGHSLLAVRVFARIEELTGQVYPLTSLFKAPTVASFAELLRAEGWRTDWTSMAAVQSRGSRRPYFVVSPFRITALSFARLARELGPDQPLYVFQPQGIDSDAPGHDTVEHMAAHYISEMKQVQPTGPYAVGGHCAGNWVAFEMAHQLQHGGDEVGALVLVDSEPPGIEPPPRRRVVHVVQRVGHYARERRMRDSVRWQIGLARDRMVARFSGHQARARVAQVRAAHAAAHDRYTGAIVAGDATLIRSEESTGLADKDWHLRWAEVITGDLRVEVVPGAHATLLEDANVGVLASLIATAIRSSTEPAIA